MVLMADVQLPQRAIREQMASAVNLIVHQTRLKDGTRRITHLTEVQGMEGEVITLQDIFLFDFHAGLDDAGQHQGVLRSTGLRPRFLDTLADRGEAVPAAAFGVQGYQR
jgi:pilus assembly protein CpaF